MYASKQELIPFTEMEEGHTKQNKTKQQQQ
jgi:hypothetical protein